MLIFVLFQPYVRFHILVGFGWLSDHLLGNSCSHGLQYAFLVLRMCMLCLGTSYMMKNLQRKASHRIVGGYDGDLERRT